MEGKFYDIGGGYTFHLEKTSSGYWMLAEQEKGFVMRHMFSTTGRLYGNTRTIIASIMPEDVFEIISNTDPLDIIEYTDEDGNITYDMKGCMEARDLTAEEVFSAVRALVEPYDEED